MIKEIDKKIYGYTLKNAIHYGGKSNSGAVLSALFNEGLEKSKVKEVMPKIQKVINEISKLNLDEQKKEFEKYSEIISEREVRVGLPELPNAEKGVIMRIAPSASGPLHVMHGINLSLSFDYVKKYGGKMIVRIEDTNPENIDKNSYKLIKEDTNFLTNNEAEIFIQSDRMDLYYSYSASLIEKGKAYVCTCSGDEFREFSKNQKDCPCRKKNVKENVLDWEKMLNKKGFKEGEAVLRFKSTMSHKNPAMRDFPLARINETPHPRQKKKYKVWPLMNLSVATDDMDMKMTHIIRGKDHRDNSERQKLIFETFKVNFPWTAFLGRTHFKEMELSTSKFRKEIEEGKYSGWGDPKLPTIQSLKKRGYKPQAFWKMAEHLGLSEVDKIISSKDFFEVLNNFNKENKS